MKWRLFLASWILFAVMFATNIVREHYPALALVEDGTYAVDRYHDLHSDIFEHAGHWFINNNTGTSLIAALALLPFKPFLHALEREPAGPVDTSFETPYPNRARFYRLVRERGLELKFGAVAAITAVLLMAPLSALCVVLMARFLRDRGVQPLRATLLALLFGFGTPMLFRTAHLNHNMMVAYASFGAFLAMARDRPLLAGLLAGAGVMCDYSGVIPLAWLGGFSLSRVRGQGWRVPALVAAGAAIPILVQAHAQYACFGSWIHPPATWMADANFTDRGYRGFSWPAPDLFLANLLEPRFGLFAFGPLLLLALVPPRRGDPSVPLPRRAWAWAMAYSFTFMLFAAANQYGRMQWNTGIRYLMPLVPLWFIAACNHLVTPRRVWPWIIGGSAVLHAFVVSMRRLTFESLSDGWGVLGDWHAFLTEGPRLPWIDVLGRTATGRGRIPEGAWIHAVILLAAVAVAILVLRNGWRARARTQPPPGA